MTVLAAVALAVLVVGVAAQAAAPRGGGARLAANLCGKLQVKLGDGFAARFGSTSDCEASLVAAAQAARQACKESEHLRHCVKGQLWSAVRARVGVRAPKIAQARAAMATCAATATPRTQEFRACVRAAVRGTA
jgi:hypothetical protein